LLPQTTYKTRAEPPEEKKGVPVNMGWGKLCKWRLQNFRAKPCSSSRRHKEDGDETGSCELRLAVNSPMRLDFVEIRSIIQHSKLEMNI